MQQRISMHSSCWRDKTIPFSVIFIMLSLARCAVLAVALNGQRIVSVVLNVCKDFSFWPFAEIFLPPTIGNGNNWTHRRQLTLFYLCKDFSFWRIAEKQSLPPAIDDGDNGTLQLPLLVEVSLTWSVQVMLFWYCGRSKHGPTSCRGDEAKMEVK